MRVPCLGSKEIKPLNPKEINPEYSLEGLILKQMLQYFGHLMRRANTLEKIMMLGKIEGRRRWWQQRMRWLDTITDSMDMNLSKLRKMLKDRGACGAGEDFSKSLELQGDQISSVQFNCSVLSNSLQSHGLQHTRLRCPLPAPRTYSNSCQIGRAHV